MAQAMARPQGGIAGLAPQSAQRMAGGGIVPPNFTDLIRDPETGKLIPKEAYDQKYPEKVTEKSFLSRAGDRAQEFAKWLNTNPLEERVRAALGNLSREEREELARRLAEKRDARMAGGGIVAFQEGGSLSEEERRRRELFYAQNLATDPLLQRIEAVIRSRAENSPARGKFGAQSFESADEIRNYLPLPASTMPARTAGMAGVDDRGGPPDLAPGPDTGTRDMGGAGIMIDGQPLAAQGQAQSAPGRSGAFDQVGEVSPTKVEEKSSMAEEIRSGIQTLRGRGDPGFEMRDLGSYAEELLGRTAKKGTGMDRAARLEALGAPTMSQRERLLNVLSAAG